MADAVYRQFAETAFLEQITPQQRKSLADCMRAVKLGLTYEDNRLDLLIERFEEE